MAAQLVAVLDVVVNQGEVVDQLDRDRRRQRPGRFAPERLARPECQRRADPLARGIVRRVPLGIRVAEVVRGHLPKQPRRTGSRFPEP